MSNCNALYPLLLAILCHPLILPPQFGLKKYANFDSQNGQVNMDGSNVFPNVINCLHLSRKFPFKVTVHDCADLLLSDR